VDAEGLGVLSASHDLNLASQYCDRLILLKNGAKEADGPPADVLNEVLIERVYGCATLVDPHPLTGRPRVTLIPGERG
jgi:iron complex transport system ATP-binding protein